MSIRAAIFIDANYLRHVLRGEHGGVRLDLARLSAQLVGAAMPLRTYYYDCLPYQGSPPTEEERTRYTTQRRFFEALERLPRFSVRLGRLERRGPDASGNFTFEQKRVDILLGVDLVSLATKGAVQEAIIVAGDSDFVPAIDAAKREGVAVRLFHGATYHSDLWRAADERFQISRELVEATRQSED